MCDYVNNANVESNDYISLLPCDYQKNYSCKSSSDPNIMTDCLGDNPINTTTNTTNDSSQVTQCITRNGLYNPRQNSISDITSCLLASGIKCNYPVNGQNPINSSYPVSCIVGTNKCNYMYNYDNSGRLPYPLGIAPQGYPILNPPDTPIPGYNVAQHIPSSPSCTPNFPPSAPPSIAPSKPVAPTITNTYNLYPFMLPITIPSIVKLTDPNYNEDGKPDKSVIPFWLKEPSIPSNPNGSANYSDRAVDFNSTGRPIAREYGKWIGLTAALSKCNELDGTPYPLCSNTSTPSNTPCSTPNNPILKPNCYAVVTQTSYTGILDSPTAVTYNYNLVELPNAESVANSLSQFAPRPKPDYDNNYLFCQPLFYTWVKKNPSNSPYFVPPTSTCVNTPSLRTPSSRAPAPTRCPSIYQPANLRCPGPVYNVGAPPPPLQNDVPADFWAPAPPVDLNSLGGYTSKKVDNTTRNLYIYIGIGVVVVGGILYWYLNYGPGAPPDVEIPSPIKMSLKATKIIKKGGYFFYK